MTRSIYEIIHICTAVVDEMTEKNQGFNGIRTRDLRDTGALLYQLSYEATHWERGQLVATTAVQI